MVKKQQSIFTTYTPLMSNVSLRINIVTEEIFGIVWYNGEVRTYDDDRAQLLKDYEDVYNFVKSNDRLGKWLTHYHNFFNYEDGTYLDNMLLSVRNRYKKPFNRYVRYL